MSTREAIIEAAAKIFAEKGYEGMTIKLIADEVGVTPPAVYAFFKNKEEVFLQVYRLVLTDHFDIAAYHSEKLQDLPVKEQLYKILVELFNYHIREELQVKIFMRLLLFPPDVFPVNLKEELIKVEEMEIDLFSRIFERGIQSGELRPGDSRAYAVAMLCLMDGLFWQLQRYDGEAFWKKFILAWTQFWEGIAKRD